MKANLTRVVEEGGDSDHGTPTPTPSPAPTPVPAGCEEVETALMELVKAEKWASALRHARHNRFVRIMLLFSTDMNLFLFVPSFCYWLFLSMHNILLNTQVQMVTL